jgi:hypothetical protein
LSAETENVQLHESLPLEDASVDVVIRTAWSSSCPKNGAPACSVGEVNVVAG